MRQAEHPCPAPQCPASSAAPVPCLLLPAESELSSNCVLELVQTKGHLWTPGSPVPRAGLPCSWARREERGLKKVWMNKAPLCLCLLSHVFMGQSSVSAHNTESARKEDSIRDSSQSLREEAGRTKSHKPPCTYSPGSRTVVHCPSHITQWTTEQYGDRDRDSQKQQQWHNRAHRRCINLCLNLEHISSQLPLLPDA